MNTSGEVADLMVKEGLQITEEVVKGSHVGFVENLRTNTSMIRKIVNNEKLIIEELTIGKLNKTQMAKLKVLGAFGNLPEKEVHTLL